MVLAFLFVSDFLLFAFYLVISSLFAFNLFISLRFAFC
jgi:hypothetical protein